MKLAGLASLALAAAVACAVGATSVAAEQQTKTPCSPGLVKVTAAGAAAVYDGPGGSKIGYLAPGASYFLVESRGRESRDLWHLLVARGGAHIGWIRSLDGTTSREACPHNLPPIELYGTRKREQQGTESQIPK